ncbi:MAG: S1/P1 nuclease [Alistipes sp.]|nr:S1/P1 nuclease [Alistipes sp.]
MKKLLLLCIVAVMACGTSYGWDRRAHATIAKIAENHLTSTTKMLLDEYLHGKSIVYYASYADDYKPELLVDLGYEPSNAKRKVSFPHTFEANEDGSVFRGMRKGDKFVKNCVAFADEYAANLRANHRTMNDSLRVLSIAMLVHWLGDMHSPSHIRYPDDQTICNYPVVYGGKQLRKYHSVWDGVLFGSLYPWGFSDCALLLDTHSPQEIAEMTKGDIYDWGKDSAIASRPVHEYKEGAVINAHDYKVRFASLAEQQVCKAGYRLAKLLNSIFK